MTSWTLTTQASGSVTADYVTSGPPSLTRGETATFAFRAPSQSEFNVLRSLADYAGQYAPIPSVNGVQNYLSQLPSRATVNSLLVGIEPDSDLQNQGINGVWGLVDRGADERNQPLSNHAYTLEVRVLSEYSEYADHNAVQSDLEVNL